jgi:hypothetical protein
MRKTECEIEKRTAICRFSLALEKPKAILGEMKMRCVLSGLWHLYVVKQRRLEQAR